MKHSSVPCGPVELQWVPSRECYYWETDNIQITVYPDGGWDVMLVDHMLCAACDDPETAAQEVASLLSAVAPGLLIFGGRVTMHDISCLHCEIV